MRARICDAKGWCGVFIGSNAELAVAPMWDDLWEQQLIAQAIRMIRQECQDSLMFRAFEQDVLLGRSAEIVAAEL